MKSTYLMLFLCLIMPLSSGAYPLVTYEHNGITETIEIIPQEYEVGFPQPVPDNQLAHDLVVPVAPHRVDILAVLEEARNQNEPLDRRGFLPFVCAVTCPAMVVILFIRGLIN